MTIVTRFPPSPTGFMHIGTARVALYNWLYARKHGGRMLFRIEDTDRARHSEEAVVALINSLEWLGLQWDGDIVSQYSRKERHAEVARALLAKGAAYHCYCTPAELEAMREKAKAEGLPTMYDRRWRDSKATPPSGVDPVIRIKAPLSGENTVSDHVQDDVTVASEQLDDFILLRSDGTPTYLLAVVVDDHDFGITHVIRGDDHLNNTFRQNLVYDGMGWKRPEYAHLPMILGPDGSKMSKRHGAASVEEYRAMGYLPEAVLNYILRLGWSHGDDEIITMAQAQEWFNLEHVQKSAARFDFAKLESLNAHYMQVADNERLLELAVPFIEQRHGVTVDDTGRKRLLAGMDELKKRAKTLLQLVDEGAFYCKKPGNFPDSFDEKAQQTLRDSSKILEFLHSRLSSLGTFTAIEIETSCKDIANKEADGKLGKVAMPLRAALTSTTVSPSIFHAAEILGKEETLARLSVVVEI